MKKRTTRKVNIAPGLQTVLMILLALELCAAVLLSTRLLSSGERTNRISLTEGGANTVVTVHGGGNSAPRGARLRTLRAAPAGLRRLSDSDFTASDLDKVWETETEVEIFRIHYDNNGDMVYTVASSDGDKLLAPGSGNSYAFTLANTGRMPLDFTLSFECWQEGSDTVLPIEARLLDGSGVYLLGDESAWAPARELNDAQDARALRSGQSVDYVFEWVWPFEREDEEHGVGYYDAEDTGLGNAAMDGDISLHIRILTVAEIDEELLEIDDGPIALTNYTGRAWALVNLICTILSVLLGVYELVIFLRGHKENDKAKEYAISEGEIYQKRVKRRKRKVWDLIPAVGAVVAFLLTEDMRLPMTIIDRWTPLMAVILAISVTVALLTRIQRFKKMVEDALAERDETVGAT